MLYSKKTRKFYNKLKVKAQNLAEKEYKKILNGIHKNHSRDIVKLSDKHLREVNTITINFEKDIKTLTTEHNKIIKKLTSENYKNLKEITELHNKKITSLRERYNKRIVEKENAILYWEEQVQELNNILVEAGQALDKNFLDFENLLKILGNYSHKINDFKKLKRKLTNHVKSSINSEEKKENILKRIV